ncbi:MAG: HDOD domain-containing protein, partial [Planctomycetota bacterium]
AKLSGIVPPEEAFLAGIVHDVGKLMFFDLAAEAYHRAVKEATPRDIVKVENDLFGVNHQELGLRCADEWGLPYEIAEVIGAHHSAFEDNDNPELVNLVGVAESLTRMWGVGASKLSGEELPELIASSPFPLDMELLNKLESVVHDDFVALRSAFIE